MKDYLNNDERLSIISFLKIGEKSKELIEGNLLNKEEKANLKRSVTFMSKAVLSVLKRLNPDAVKAFNRAVQNTKVFVSSNSDIDVYSKRKSKDIEAAYEENREYFRLVELIMFYNCQNCETCGNECLFYKEFEENCIPEMEAGVNECNCKYAYKLKTEKKG